MKNGEEKQKDRRILKVYTLNGKSFEERIIPENVTINKPQKIITEIEQYNQPSLFDQQIEYKESHE